MEYYSNLAFEYLKENLHFLIRFNHNDDLIFGVTLPSNIFINYIRKFLNNYINRIILMYTLLLYINTTTTAYTEV